MIPKEIILDGESKKNATGGAERFLCYVDGNKFYLPGTEFVMLSILIIESDRKGGSVVADFQLKPEEAVPKYLYRLRSTLHKMLPEYQGWPVYENRRDRKYVLHGRPSMTVKVSGRMKQFNDSRVAELAKYWLAKHPETTSHRQSPFNDVKA